MAVTQVSRVSQCAEIHKMALGLGKILATSRQAFENSLSSMAFIGLPCPMNNTGIGSELFRYWRVYPFLSDSWQLLIAIIQPLLDHAVTESCTITASVLHGDRNLLTGSDPVQPV